MQANDPLLPQVRPDVSAPKPPPQLQSVQQTSVPNAVPLPQSMTMPPSKPKRKLPLLPIGLALGVCLLIIGSATAIFIISGRSQDEQAQTIDDSSVTQVDEGKVSTGDVDAVSKKIDESLNSINDSADFRSDDLSDQTLGL